MNKPSQIKLLGSETIFGDNFSKIRITIYLSIVVRFMPFSMPQVAGRAASKLYECLQCALSHLQGRRPSGTLEGTSCLFLSSHLRLS